MHLHDYYTMNNIREQMKVMSDTPDIIVSSLLLQSINPRGAIELGAGSVRTGVPGGSSGHCGWKG
jgi:hypothetical protein